MQPSVTFWAYHEPSNSRALVEFGLFSTWHKTFYKKSVKLMGMAFTAGNVMDIETFRKMRAHAIRILLEP
jgi:hypothetical protein